MLKGPALLAIIATALAVPMADNGWEQYKLKHGKKYNPTEDGLRYLNYLKALKFVQEHNKLHAEGKTTFTVAMNKFADWTPEEFARRNGYLMRNSTQQMVVEKLVNPNGNPGEVDWRSQGYVTGVKDQGQCGSCWAFGTTGVLEGQLFKNTGDLVSLSESNLVDCDTGINQGCGGGWQEVAYLYVEKNGLDTEDSYPYKPYVGPQRNIATFDRNCAYKAKDVAVHCTGFKSVAKKDEDALETAVATVGPITIAIDASHMSFQLYQSGVYYEPRCSQTVLDHAVLAVGYGAESGDNFWLVKNSWGVSWGEQGYIKMAKNRDNNCGVATEASYPTGVTH